MWGSFHFTLILKRLIHLILLLTQEKINYVQSYFICSDPIYNLSFRKLLGPKRLVEAVLKFEDNRPINRLTVWTSEKKKLLSLRISTDVHLLLTKCTRFPVEFGFGRCRPGAKICWYPILGIFVDNMCVQTILCTFLYPSNTHSKYINRSKVNFMLFLALFLISLQLRIDFKS